MFDYKRLKSVPLLADEFGGFVANPSAQQRGGAVVLAARGKKCQGLLEKMAQAEVNRLLRVEIARKVGLVLV